VALTSRRRTTTNGPRSQEGDDGKAWVGRAAFKTSKGQGVGRTGGEGVRVARTNTLGNLRVWTRATDWTGPPGGSGTDWEWWLSGCLPKNNGANHSVRWSAGRIVKKKQEQQGDPSRTDSAGGSELAGLSLFRGPRVEGRRVLGSGGRKFGQWWRRGNDRQDQCAQARHRERPRLTGVDPFTGVLVEKE
jgi:hypothetical protein